MRILYCSNAPWTVSGYGVQGASLVPRLAALDDVEEVGVFAWYGHEGRPIVLNGYKVYGRGFDPYGNDMYQGHARAFGADVVITLIDAWVLQDMVNQIAPAEWWPWFPIDCDPAPGRVIEAVKDAHQPIVYSKWGQRMCAEAGLETAYVPHGVEPMVFRVLEDDIPVQQFREQSFAGKEFVVGMVAANKGTDDRKGFAAQFEAFSRFAKDKPNVALYCHCLPQVPMASLDLLMLADKLDILDKIVWPDHYRYKVGFPDQWMAMMYNSLDLYMGNAKAEGFGIPIIEAQACGTPVIVTDFSSMPELVRWGEVVEPAGREWHMGFGSWRAIPDVNKIHEELEIHYHEFMSYGGWPDDLRQDTQQYIHDMYGWDTVVNNWWRPLIEEKANGSSGSS